MSINIKILYTDVPGLVVHNDPNIIFCGIGGSDMLPLSIASVDNFLDVAVDCFIFFCPQWSFQKNSIFRDFYAGKLNACAKKYPGHKFTLLVNDPLDMDMSCLIDPSISIYVWNTNCTIDYSQFLSVSEAESLLYSAFFNSRVSPYKRISLARNVSNLAFVTSGVNESNESKIYEIARKELPSAALLNWSEFGNYRRLRIDEIISKLNSSKCGLILSEVEGQTRAVMEYLLAGLPVITTPSVGGRDRFLNPCNSIYVKPDPDSISKVVLDVDNYFFSRDLIRSNAISSLKSERRLLLQILNDRLNVNFTSFDCLDFTGQGSSHLNKVKYFYDKLELKIY